MNRIDTLIKNKSAGPLLMSHLIGGYPTLPDSLAVARAMITGGSSILEIQIPFSDPLADGPAIVEASHAALAGGTRVKDVLELVATIRKESDIAIALMSYANPVYRHGIDAFVELAHQAGVDALIVPDLPLDSTEGQALVAACSTRGMHAILVLSPGVPPERVEALKGLAGGFVYCTTRRGITGANSTFAEGLEGYLAQVREITGLPLAVGFGVKSREDVQSIAPYAEVVIAGSAFVETIKLTKSEDLPRVIEVQVRDLLA